MDQDETTKFIFICNKNQGLSPRLHKGQLLIMAVLSSLYSFVISIAQLSANDFLLN